MPTPEPDRLAAALGPEVVNAAGALARALGQDDWLTVVERLGLVDALIAREGAALLAHDAGEIVALSPLSAAVAALLPSSRAWSRRAVVTALCAWLGVNITQPRLLSVRSPRPRLRARPPA